MNKCILMTWDEWTLTWLKYFYPKLKNMCLRIAFLYLMSYENMFDVMYVRSLNTFDHSIRGSGYPSTGQTSLNVSPIPRISLTSCWVAFGGPERKIMKINWNEKRCFDWDKDHAMKLTNKGTFVYTRRFNFSMHAFLFSNRKIPNQNVPHCCAFLPWLSKTTLVWPRWLWKRMRFLHA